MWITTHGLSSDTPGNPVLHIYFWVCHLWIQNSDCCDKCDSWDVNCHHCSLSPHCHCPCSYPITPCFLPAAPLIEGCGLISMVPPPDASQQHWLWGWEWGSGRNQVAQDFTGDVVCPWGGEPNGSNLNLTPKLTQLLHGKLGQQRGRGPCNGGASLLLTWWTAGQQDQPNAYVANPTMTWPAQHLCGKTTTAGVTHMWQPPWWQDQYSNRVMNPTMVVPAPCWHRQWGPQW